MRYTVFYKEPGAKKWEALENVKGDLLLFADVQEEMKSPDGKVVGIRRYKSHLPVRVILLEDDTRIEIPMTWIIKFSKERHLSILKDMKRESGKDLQVLDN